MTKKNIDGYMIEEFINKINKDEVKTILELGARYGDESLELHEWHPDATIHSVECNPYVTETTRAKLANHPKITLHEIAVSNTIQEDVTFYPASGNVGASSLYVASLGKWWGDHQPIKIKTTRLDDYFKLNNISKIDLICADIQGGELNAFKGMGEFLKDVKYIITEMPQGQPSYHGAPSEIELTTFLKDAGFEIVASYAYPTNPYEKDVLFVRK